MDFELFWLFVLELQTHRQTSRQRTTTRNETG